MKEKEKILVRTFDGVMPEDARTKFGRNLANKHLRCYLKGKEVFKYHGRFFIVKSTLKYE